MNDFLSISLIGAGLSVAIQYIKNKFGSNSLETKAITVILASMIGALYFYFSQLDIWSSVLGILASASTVYALLLKK